MDYKNQIAETIAAVVPELDNATILSKIEVPKDASMGDYAFPTFLLAKARRMAPQQIATNIVSEITTDGFKEVKAVGPYVNFFLDQAQFGADTLAEVLRQTDYGHNTDGEAGHITIDMSSPNIAKPMSMGHLRSTVIGNSLAEIAKANGYQPIKINHLGDWGTQFGKLMSAYKRWGSEEEVKADPINTLVKYYVRFHKEAETQPELNDEGRAWFKKLEDGDEEAHELWSWFREESLKEFMELYNDLDIDFDSFNGEAFYNDKMDAVIDTLKEKHLLVESQGAQVVDLEDEGLNVAMIQRTDGATLYMTRDLAAAIFRKNNYNFVKSLYVVGGEQREHFMQMKAVLKKMGYEWSDDIEHIPFGMITVDGKKLSTRSGRIILLKDVLADSVKLATAQIDEKNPNLANKEVVAHEVGTGAVVFHDLMNERLGNFDFKLEEVVRFEGDTGPYVQYTNARAQSILRKAGKPELDLNNLSIDDEQVWETEKLVASFNDIVRRAWRDREPSVIAKYSLNLARAFNKYYANSKILVEDDQLNARLALVTAVSYVLTESLRLLGVKAPKEM
ncbi:arginine--tRNA ligase [Weissella paramesenteroides]|uniref:arginine--tRNA ligase n=1 Tax=Weissella paramesenteroides TaxID=1249 RepID=UPI00103C8E66|nr:arginine--tRNA ligase [Weissella paramesenteroides]MCM6765343.1 arginine--tRNA ligase [Weissella paramesenteroides]MCM6766714.1 arginine--tRNA ligase [Weissella paramesenteroides]MCM6769135.1 arginine--tRNA ligase [Weissella paramesenteroides]MCM6771522.1 arginine--tRNA ligase [Weissella paramesenteroides]MCM6779385.1 arginine--tRNA ligase [Weissella paramesenteroides]